MRIALLLLLAILVAGCAQAPVRDGKAIFAIQKDRLAGLENWSINGRFAIRYQDEGGSGLIRWVRTGDDYDLRLYDAIGRMQLRLWRESGVVRMQSRENGTQTSESAEQLMQAQIGWSLPVTALDRWARGLEAPNMSVDEYVVDGLYVRRLVQGAWQIDYSRHELVDKLWVPGLIHIQGDDISLKVIVETWKLS